MAMFQCFKRVDGQYPGSKLPDPQGALAQEVPSRAISAANTEVALLQQAGGARVSTRGTYLKMSSEKKAEIGKRAAEPGTEYWHKEVLHKEVPRGSMHPKPGPYITFFARGGNQEENCLTFFQDC